MSAEHDALEAPPYAAARVEVLRLPEGASEPDQVAVEEPLEIRIGGRPVAVTMRTPGHDEELALGFCLSGHRPPHFLREVHRLYLDLRHLDAPGIGVLVEDLLQTRVELIALG